jgi:hypothetical protein
MVTSATQPQGQESSMAKLSWITAVGLAGSLVASVSNAQLAPAKSAAAPAPTAAPAAPAATAAKAAPTLALTAKAPGTAGSGGTEVQRSISGFDTPESVYWDAPSKAWYVANVAGSPVDKDGKGWISKLDASGKILEAKWVEGLNAPKGLRVHAGTLIVSDIDEVVFIDLRKHAVKQKVAIGGAKFLNDTAVDAKGNVYVSDTFTNTVYRLGRDRKAEVFVQGEQLEGPNGLLVDGKSLLVAAWGVITEPKTFGTKTAGRILTIDLKTKKVEPLGAGAVLGNLDGIEKDGASYLVTDWVAGKLFRVAADGTSTELKAGFKTSADFGYNAETRQVFIPEMMAGKVTIETLAPATK